MKSKRCEGWRRYGGAFSLGPVKWEQCKALATVMITFKDPETRKKKTLPACKECAAECWRTGLKILKTQPI